MNILTLVSRIFAGRLLCSFFLAQFLVSDIQAFCQCAAEKTLLPSIKQKKDLPIFSIYFVPALKIGANHSASPRVVLAVWDDGYCMYSEDRVKGGPPYKQASLPKGEIINVTRTLSSFAPPKITSYFLPDSSSTTIAFQDKITGRCISLRSSHEHYPKQVYSQQYDTFFHKWEELKKLGRSIRFENASVIEGIEFTLSPCVPESVNVGLLLQHIGPERKTIPPVVLFSGDEGCQSAISDVPENLREFVKKEPIRGDVVTALYGFIIGKPSSSNTGFGATRVAFHWPKDRMEYILDVHQMREFKVKWQKLSPLPPAVVDYFTRIGLTDENSM